MSTNCTDEALSNDITHKIGFLFVITYLCSNIIQKSGAQPHVPPQIKWALKDALSLFMRLQKDLNKMIFMRWKKYKILS